MPEFTLQDAILAGRLVPYEYYPHRVTLTDEEEDEWTNISEKIGREAAIAGIALDSSNALPDSIKQLLIKRARIAKKAANKLSLATNIVIDNYREGHRWLVYCEDTGQLTEVTTALRKKGLNALEYHFQMDGAPDETLDWFTRFGGVLVSIRCLDEGVDIPQTSHALILASSKNPREFIQRRGRVLRSAPGKNSAVIHDALVVPGNTVPEAAILNLTKSELSRALEFSQSALNKSAQIELLSLAADLSISPYLFAKVGLEND
jgi:superfamily II DNA or RNA helicase